MSWNYLAISRNGAYISLNRSRLEYSAATRDPHLKNGMCHYSDVIMGAIASQITSLTIIYSTVYSGAYQRKHQSSASLAFMREFTGHRWIPRTNGQWRGKSFHLMASPWRPETIQRTGYFAFHYFSRTPGAASILNYLIWLALKEKSRDIRLFILSNHQERDGDRYLWRISHHRTPEPPATTIRTSYKSWFNEYIL